LKDPALERVGRLVAETEFVNRAIRERLFLIADARARYLNFLEKFEHFRSRIPQHKIASFLGLNPVTLSRVVQGLRNTEDSCEKADR
jgi:hypothetical protein